MKRFGLRILLLLTILVVFGSAGSAWAAVSSETNPIDLTTEQWRGHSFTFLALPADKQAAGYEIFTVDQANQGFKGDHSVRISYAEHVGKQVTVTEIVPFAAGYNQSEYMVHMTVNDTGEKLIGRTMRGQLEGLVLTSDLVNARKQFLGKTIYPKCRELSGLYVPDTVPTTVPITFGGPVTVVDVYAGNQS